MSRLLALLAALLAAHLGARDKRKGSHRQKTHGTAAGYGVDGPKARRARKSAKGAKVVAAKKAAKQRASDVKESRPLPREPYELEQRSRLLSKAAVDAWGEEHYTAKDDLEADERDAATDYVGAGYQMVNKIMRGLPTPAIVPSDYDAQIGSLKKLLNRHPLPEDIVAHRGTDPRAFGMGADERIGPEALAGKTFEEPAFMSTSVDPVPTREFSSYPVQIRFTVPEGTPSYYAPNLEHRNRGEYELLLGPKRKFHVIDAEYGDDSWGGDPNTLYVDAIILPEEP